MDTHTTDVSKFIPITPEETKKALHESFLDSKRKTFLRDMTITNNDLIITSKPSIIYHTDLQGKVKISNVIAGIRDSDFKKMTGYGNTSLSNFLIFDKNFNYLAIDQPKYNKIKTRRNRIRIKSFEIHNTYYSVIGEISSFVIINKENFVQSKGKIWNIKYRQNISYEEIKKIKKDFQKRFTAMKTIILELRKIIGRLYLEENFDFRYSINAPKINANYNDFGIIIRHTNVIIRNSIEMRHYIGDMIVKISGTHEHTANRKFPITLYDGIYGMRMSFTSSDAAMKYQHSHLTTAMCSLQSFCIGHEDYSILGKDVTEIDLEQLLFRIEEFLSWESLEGGPHYKIENINICGSKFIFSKNSRSLTSVGESYAKCVISEIKKRDGFNKLKNCFQLIIDRGVLKYVLDQNKFFEEFIGMFNTDEIKEIHDSNHTSLYRYNSINKEFNHVDNTSMTNAKSIVKKAFKNIQTIDPIHINEKYYRPYLTEYTGKDLLEGVLFSFDPNFMLEIGNYILYHLITKLETYENN